MVWDGGRRSAAFACVAGQDRQQASFDETILSD
jgi:hypothetical protein